MSTDINLEDVDQKLAKAAEKVEVKQEPEIQVKSTPPFKLKDKPRRRFQAINLRRQFGFLPETIIIEKIYGVSNGLIVRAILTKEEIEKENKAKAELKAIEVKK